MRGADDEEASCEMMEGFEEREGGIDKGRERDYEGE